MVFFRLLALLCLYTAFASAQNITLENGEKQALMALITGLMTSAGHVDLSEGSMYFKCTLSPSDLSSASLSPDTRSLFCTNDGHVEAIVFPDSGLQGRFDAVHPTTNVSIWLSFADYLKHVVLHSNDFTGSLPSSMSSLSRLQSLFVHNNDFLSPIPDWSSPSSFRTNLQFCILQAKSEMFDIEERTVFSCPYPPNVKDLIPSSCRVFGWTNCTGLDSAESTTLHELFGRQYDVYERMYKHSNHSLEGDGDDLFGTIRCPAKICSPASFGVLPLREGRKIAVFLCRFCLWFSSSSLFHHTLLGF